MRVTRGGLDRATSLAGLGAVALACALSGCHPRTPAATTVPEAAPAEPPFTASHIRSYTDTFAVTSIADSPSNLWVGTTHGLLRWDLASGRYATITAASGLSDDRVLAVTVDEQGEVWVATKSGTAVGFRGSWQKVPPPPVGDFVTGLVSGPERSLWAGGPEGWRASGARTGSTTCRTPA